MIEWPGRQTIRRIWWMVSRIGREGEKRGRRRNQSRGMEVDCLSVSLPTCLSICLLPSLSVFLLSVSLSLPVLLSIFLLPFLSIRLSICLSQTVCSSVVFTHMQICCIFLFS